jgi:dihydroxy-acid dehydratase
VKRRRIELLIDDAEMQKRARTSTRRLDAPQRGYARLFAEQILGADEGCDFGFLMPK